MNDNELHSALDWIAREDSLSIELIPGWDKQLPFFGWFWRKFDWDRIPLGRDNDKDGENYHLVGIMPKNKWYNDEYYCNKIESQHIRGMCEEIAKEYSAIKIRGLTVFLQELGKRVQWQECDREAIDERTKQDFMNGNYKLISLDDFLAPKDESNANSHNH